MNNQLNLLAVGRAWTKTELAPIGSINWQTMSAGLVKGTTAIKRTVLAALPTDGFTIVLALHEACFPALLEIAQRVPNVIAVDSEAEARALARRLLDGADPAALAWPTLPLPGRLLGDWDQATARHRAIAQPKTAGAGGTADQAPQPSSNATDQPDKVGPAKRGAWFTLDGDNVVFQPSALAPLAASAAQRPDGPPLRHSDEQHLLIAPFNYAGQGRAWAKAVEWHVPGFTAANLAVLYAGGHSGLLFPADLTVDAEDWLKPSVRLALARDMVAPASHVLVEDLGVFLGTEWTSRADASPALAEREVARLLESGRQVAVLLHGSVARAPAAHGQIYPFSPFRAGDWDVVTARAEAVVAAVDRLGVPLFTATPDMQEYLPDAPMVPVTISAADFTPPEPWHPAKPLRVAHVPSSGLKKGSGAVDQAMDRLAASGLITYQRLSGIPPMAMTTVIRGADVVIDQVVLGNPATLLAQTMAAGRLAVANLSTATRRRLPAPPPVVQADPANLGDVIEHIARQPEDYADLAAAGPAFARLVHDGRMAAQVLEQHFLAVK